MLTHVAVALTDGGAEAAGRTLAQDVAAQLAGRPPVLVILFGSTAQPLDRLLAAYRETAAAAPDAAAAPGPVLLGVSTTGEFTHRGDATGSASVFALAGDFRVFAGVGRHLKGSVEHAVTEALHDIPTEQAGYPYRTALLLLDGLAGAGEEAALTAAALLGPGVRLAGGCAGDDWRLAATHVACGTQTCTDALVVAMIFSKEPIGLGVCHAHRPFTEALPVTRAVDNVVYEIAGQPAFQVWQARTRDQAVSDGVEPVARTPGEQLQNFARYEAGVRQHGELRIRMPLVRGADDSMAFACGMPEGTPIHFVKSTAEQQLEAARAAARRARAQLGGRAVAGALVFDCACRKLILEDQFGTAVRAMSEELGGAPLAGFESYGEVALNDDDMSGFHNTTTVLLAFPRGTDDAPESDPAPDGGA